jgi:hypothetical protein
MWGNKRAEMWGGVRQWLKEGGAFPKDQVLYNDLISVETKPRMDGIIQLMSKVDMKRVLSLPSPNRGDALALTFAHPVQSLRAGFNPAGIGPGSIRRISTDDYDPFADDKPRIDTRSSFQDALRSYDPHR